MMTFRETRRLIRSDRCAAARGQRDSWLAHLHVHWFHCGFRAVALYRWARLFRERGWRLAARWLSHRARLRYGIEISPLATIGPGFRIAHGVGVVIGCDVVIGANCLVFQGVTLGSVASELYPDRRGAPCLEDDVIVYAGAKVVGPIRVGKGAVVAANAVVTTDVVSGSIVGGIPARRIGERPP